MRMGESNHHPIHVCATDDEFLPPEQTGVSPHSTFTRASCLVRKRWQAFVCMVWDEHVSSSKPSTLKACSLRRVDLVQSPVVVPGYYS